MPTDQRQNGGQGRLMNTICVVVDQIVTILVEGRTQVRLSNGETDTVGETLTKGASRDLNAIRVACFGVTGRQRVNLTELLEVVHGELVTQEVEQDVLECATNASTSIQHDSDGCGRK